MGNEHIQFGRHSEHELGDFYYAYDVSGSGEFERFVAWIESIETKHYSRVDDSCGWVFAPWGDGEFWFRMFWCAEVHDDAKTLYDDYDDGWDSDEFYAWREQERVEEIELFEDLSYARRLRTPIYGMNDRAPMWSKLSRHRASRRNTMKSKGLS